MALTPQSQSMVDRQDAAAQAAKMRKMSAPPQAGAPAGQRAVGGRVYAGDQHSFTDYEAAPDVANQDRMMSYLGRLTGGGSAPGISRTSGAIAEKEQAARAAAFARAKEQSGQIASSALKGLQSNLASRGISGGGYAQMRTAETLAPATDRLQDFTRDQAILDLNNAQHTGDLEYTGGIQQRGQTLASVPSLMALVKAAGRPGLY